MPFGLASNSNQDTLNQRWKEGQAQAAVASQVSELEETSGDYQLFSPPRATLGRKALHSIF